ncbi:MAG: hypothetical protein JSR67_04270 [Proteobacteria bacterium]|nr:hypothetical protein [Pseudomonadota bacterium]
MHPRPAPGRYQVWPLPFIPFSGTGGEALNRHGAVVGGIANSDGSVSIAQWHQGLLTDLGAPPGFPDHGYDRPRVFGMNDRGAIVGTIHTGAGDLPSRSFIHDHDGYTVLPLRRPTDLGGAAIGINSRGEVVGYAHTARRKLVAWLWSNGVYSSLPVSGTSTVALAINSHGTVVGNRTLGRFRRLLSGELRATCQRGYIVGRGTTQYLDGFVNAINDRGETAGGSSRDGITMATVFRGGLGTVILGLPSFAVGINSSADVVGCYQRAQDNRRRLFIWSPGLGASDLTPDGYVSAQAAALNDRGDILGFGATTGGQEQYFLLTPAAEGALSPKALAATPPARAR